MMINLYICIVLDREFGKALVYPAVHTLFKQWAWMSFSVYAFTF